jgi:hypothetical protein
VEQGQVKKLIMVGHQLVTVEWEDLTNISHIMTTPDIMGTTDITDTITTTADTITTTADTITTTADTITTTRATNLVLTDKSIDIKNPFFEPRKIHNADKVSQLQTGVRY